jgi:ketosteroid isomerase-like protein
MDDHPNAAAFRRLAEQPADLDQMLDGLDENVEWHEIGNPEPLRGKEAVVKRWTSGDLGASQIDSNLHDVVANDEHTIALMENTVTRDGKSLTYRTAEIMHIKDGKVTARWAFSDDTDRINKFFGS